MTIQRLNRVISTQSPHRFTIIFGEGVEDIFINSELIELNFELGLYEELKFENFENVIFYSPHKSIYFYDKKSADFSRFTNFTDRTLKQNSFLTPGPLGGIKVLPAQSKIPNSDQLQMGDVHALRAINRVVTGTSNQQSAVVFMQAETSLLNFDDHRTLSALIGEWTSLPSTNLNRVFFCVFLRFL